ncbi:hypothetical protein GOP47_0017737 [Adiantum capillus-veneris]|uniref:Senescence-associated protein n=1 Tax=Adiantum capillus-veneris TaxID=13818 RepID=A0A9D4Z9Z1_ADICA|nr:hypothetical protein GOP47_0017737 [Adiantum capillus-veneris]
MALSLIITGVVNLITFLLSIPLVGAGIWLATKLNTECVRFLEWPIIAIGVVILLISLAGFIGACWRVPWLLYIYLVVMFFIILLLLVFIIFAFVVTKDGPAAESGRRSYSLNDYSPWLKQQMRSSSNWAKITSCIKDANVCVKMNDEYKTEAAFYSADLSSVQSGCCIPPAICGYAIAGPTTWNNPSNKDAEADCSKWSNDLGVLCYACDACRAGVVANIKREWRNVAILCVVVLVVLIIVYIIGCCAFRNAQTEDLFKRYEEQYRSRSWRRRNWFRSSAY